jgi:hypothetical protein
MFKTFKKLFKKLFKKEEEFFKEQVEIIDVLLYAKHLYILCTKEKDLESLPGMCYCIYKALKHYTNTCISYSDLTYYIPEFNAKFLNGDPLQVYWWPIVDSESRIKAFDKLIKAYE